MRKQLISETRALDLGDFLFWGIFFFAFGIFVCFGDFYSVLGDFSGYKTGKYLTQAQPKISGHFPQNISGHFPKFRNLS